MDRGRADGVPAIGVPKGTAFKLPESIVLTAEDLTDAPVKAANGLNPHHDHGAATWRHPVTNQLWCDRCYPRNERWMALFED